MRNLLVVTVALVVGTVGYSAVAWSQDTTQASTVAEKPFTISLTPRLWYQMGNGNTYNSTPNFQGSVDQTNFADYGLSAEVSARSLPNWSFILTGYYGAGSTPARGLTYFPATARTFGQVSTTEATNSYSRYDIELLARYLVAPTISVTGGFRTFNFTFGQRNNFTNIFPNTGFQNLLSTALGKTDNQYYMAEIGVLFNTPFSASGRHLLFGGTTLGLGAVTSDVNRLNISSNGTTSTPPRSSVSQFATTLDMYSGYQFLLTQSIALNIRYRAIMFAAGKIPGEVTVNHGPEIGVTTRF